MGALMKAEEWSAVLALLGALVVTLASFRQWWVMTADGGMPLRPWARVVLTGVAVLLIVALALFLVGVVGSG
jgi:hypothetical protein